MEAAAGDVFRGEPVRTVRIPEGGVKTARPQMLTQRVCSIRSLLLFLLSYDKNGKKGSPFQESMGKSVDKGGAAWYFGEKQPKEARP